MKGQSPALAALPSSFQPLISVDIITHSNSLPPSLPPANINTHTVELTSISPLAEGPPPPASWAAEDEEEEREGGGLE